MKNTVLIIGNGFDLYHHLPTRYTDFLVFVEEWEKFWSLYSKNKEQEINIEDEMFKIRLDEVGRLTSESIEDFAEHALCYEERKIEYMQKNINDNLWIQYFLESGYKKEGWIDFENEMNMVLHRIEEYYEKLPEYVGQIPNYVMNIKTRRIIELFGKKAKEPFKNNNEKVLSARDINSEKIQEQKLALLATIKEEMDILNKCLYIYLSKFVSRIKSSMYSEQVEILKNVHLLNFNYTYTYSTIYGKKNLVETHAVHGELKENNLVLGIEDDAFTELDYVYFLKYFQRIQKRTGAFYKKWISEEICKYDDGSVDVHIVGHSLDKTDKGILKDFFCAKSISKIYIYYHNQLAYESQVIHLIDMFGKEFVIDQTASGRMNFVELQLAKEGILRSGN